MPLSGKACVARRDKSPQISKQNLSAVRIEFIELMQEINFGRISHLRFRKGEPVLKPRPVVVREIKFGSDNGPRPERGTADFLLKQQVVELFDFFDELRDGEVDVLVDVVLRH